MSTALYLFLFFLIVLILIGLFLPVRLHLILDEKKKSISLGWFFMMLGADLVSKTIELRLFSQRIMSRKIRRKRKEKEEEKKIKKKGKGFNIIALWKEKDLLTKLFPIFFRFLKDILKGIHLNKFFVEADVATPDPALTGTMYGGLCALCASVHSISPDLQLRVQPDFENEIPRGRAEVAFSTRLINTVGATLKMFFALPKIRIIRAFVRLKRR